MGQESWSSAMAEINRLIAGGDDSALVWQFRAKCLANLGQVHSALEACVQSISLDSTDKHSHFIHALILAEMKEFSTASEALKRTLYLDRQFVEAHYQLGIIQMRKGDRQAGVKSLQNALRITQASDPDRQLHDAAGMTYGRMVAILKNELKVYVELTDKERNA